MTFTRIPFENYVDRGKLRASALLVMDQAHQRRLNLERHHDDLDDYEVAYYKLDGMPVVIQRYARNPANQYTVSVETERRPEDLRETLWAFFSEFNVPASAVRWIGRQP